MINFLGPAYSSLMPIFYKIWGCLIPDLTKVKASSSCRYQEDSSNLNFLKLSPEKELAIRFLKSSSRSGRLILISNLQLVIWILISSRWICAPATTIRSSISIKSACLQPVRWLVCTQMASKGEPSRLSAFLMSVVICCRYLFEISKPLRMSLKLIKLGSACRHSLMKLIKFSFMISLYLGK